MTAGAQLTSALQAAVGPAHVLLDDDLRASYETDWTGRFTGLSRAVVRPADTEQVATVLAACFSANVAVVVQGGNTGLVGGGVPADGRPVIMVTTRLAELGDVAAGTRQVTVGAGVRLAVLAAHARQAGLDFGVDLAARDSATVGGMLATNAGGIRVLRYGSMREQVAGVEAVLADGRIISRLDAPAKDSTGYDIGHLLAGSEGTLAVITRLRLRLVAAEPGRAVALVSVRGPAEAVELLAALRAGLAGLCAAEITFRPGIELVAKYLGVPVPLAATAGEAWVLVEHAAPADPLDELLTALGSCHHVLDATAGDSAADRARLWQLRESHAEAIAAAGPTVKLDVSVPLPRLADLVARLPDLIASAAPAAQLIVFGHLAEANLHVNVLDAAERGEQVTEAVLRLVSSLGGSISSEHGIGRAKARWLGLSRHPAEIAVMRSIKTAFDPRGVLNPGVLLAEPADARQSR